MAAMVISSRDFPNAGLLPKLSPPPFNNLGHMPLLDYSLMMKQIWQVVENIQVVVERFQRSRTIWRTVSFAVAIIFAILFTLGFGVEYLALALALAAGIGFAINGIAAAMQKPSLPKLIADVRADSIRSLLDDNSEQLIISKAVNQRIDAELSRVGDGALGQALVPVLTICADGNPFPGYGRLQVDNTFTCTPKEGKALDLSVENIRKAISERVLEFVRSSGIQNVTCGEAVVIHGASVDLSSSFLNEGEDGETFPPLWMDIRSRENLESRVLDDPTVRVYFAIQVCFPQYQTLATLFTRPFFAGNAVGYQVALVTLGPPAQGNGDLMERVNRHEFESSESFTTQSSNVRLNWIRRLHTRGSSSHKFQAESFDPGVLKKLDESLSQAELDSYKAEMRRVADENVFWPGYYSYYRNWREINSLTFTTHFFGKPESLAAVRALYTQVSRAILDGLDLNGYNVSDYRDEKGVYSIHADKIDQLVVGERVTITETTTEQKATVEQPKT
jgi:hypothetical protein